MAQVLVIGGGTAGIAAALNLAERGIFTTIVERSPSLGGRASELCCKGKVECVRCDVCLSMDKLYEVAQSRFIRVFTGSEVTRLTGKPGAFRATIARKHQYVSEEACTACGACAEVCPVPGSAIRPNYHRSVPKTYRIDEGACVRLGDGECDKCAKVCPAEAVNFSARGTKRYLTFNAVIVASGYSPFDAAEDKRLGYGAVKDVLTSLEVEKMINDTGRLVVPSTGIRPKKLAIIQCVGSRDERKGVPYCSKVCCKYALKIGQLVKLHDPDASVSFFFMDWRSYDLVDNELLEWGKKTAGVSVVRSRPAEILASESGKPLLRFVRTTEEKVEEEEFDLVMLSIGMLPPIDSKKVADILGTGTTDFGFISAEGAKGIFAAGCCAGPKDIEESFMDGVAAAGKAASLIGGAK